jgi:signal recognition particle subunit SRP14
MDFFFFQTSSRAIPFSRVRLLLARARTAERAAMVLVDNDAFLTELTRMFERTRERGTVSTTMKHGKVYDRPRPKSVRKLERATAAEAMANDPSWGVIVRASDGKKKVSTFVSKTAGEAFGKSLQTIQLAYIDGLMKKAKKRTPKAKKPKATIAAGAAGAGAATANAPAPTSAPAPKAAAGSKAKSKSKKGGKKK